MSDTVSKNLGVITAYGMAVQGGYTGTKEQFYLMLNEVTKGKKIVAINDITQPVAGFDQHAYTYTILGDETITFATPESGYAPSFELWLTQKSIPSSFTWGQTIIWNNQSNNFDPRNVAPDLSAGSKIYVLVFRYDGTQWLGNLAYTVSN